jgi:hypothetical protein
MIKVLPLFLIACGNQLVEFEENDSNSTVSSGSDVGGSGGEGGAVVSSGSDGDVSSSQGGSGGMVSSGQGGVGGSGGLDVTAGVGGRGAGSSTTGEGGSGLGSGGSDGVGGMTSSVGGSGGAGGSGGLDSTSVGSGGSSSQGGAGGCGQVCEFECCSDLDCGEEQVCQDNQCVCNGEETDTLECRENKTLLCHVPPGNFFNQHEICVGNNSVQAHLAHGDYLGDCANVCNY